MRMLLIIAVALSAFVAPASAQQKAEAPAQYLKLLELYKDWKPEYVDRSGEDFANSIYNWTLRVHDAGSKVVVSAARNWLFTRSEAQFNALADTYAGEAKSIFGDLFVARGMHSVFSTPYTADIHGLFGAWYNCIANTDDGGGTESEQARVLGRVNWTDGKASVGPKGECKAALGNLSKMYGVGELSADELTTIGFLSRRETAHHNSARFLSAEIIRKAVKKVFDPE